MNFKSKKWTVPLLLLLIFISVAIFIQFSMGLGIFRDDAKGLFLNSFSKNPFSKQSEVSVSLLDSKLKLDFDLTKEDKPKFNTFVRNWFGESKDIKKISLSIDKSLSEFLQSGLPTKLILDIDERSLNFKSYSAASLQNPLVKSDFEFATASGKLSVKYTDPSKYQLSIQNPGDLVYFATSSGALTISEKIEGLFQTLPKLATIELTVNGKNIAGKIVLK